MNTQNLISNYEKNRKRSQSSKYEFVHTATIGNVVRNIYKKEGKHYIKHNGKFMQLKKYKEMKGIKTSISPQKETSEKTGKKCKKDCSKLKPPKVCNTTTARCNLKNNVKTNTKRYLKKHS